MAKDRSDPARWTAKFPTSRPVVRKRRRRQWWRNLMDRKSHRNFSDTEMSAIDRISDVKQSQDASLKESVDQMVISPFVELFIHPPREISLCHSIDTTTKRIALLTSPGTKIRMIIREERWNWASPVPVLSTGKTKSLIHDLSIHHLLFGCRNVTSSRMISNHRSWSNETNKRWNVQERKIIRKWLGWFLNSFLSQVLMQIDRGVIVIHWSMCSFSTRNYQCDATKFFSEEGNKWLYSCWTQWTIPGTQRLPSRHSETWWRTEIELEKLQIPFNRDLVHLKSRTIESEVIQYKHVRWSKTNHDCLSVLSILV